LKRRLLTHFNKLTLAVLLSLCAGNAFAQPSTVPNTAPRDTASDKTNNGKWKNQEAVITYEKLNSAKIYKPENELHTFHRLPFIQPWSRDMGNPGSPVHNLLFTPEYRVGPSFGYHIFDAYRFNVDSLNYYNTDRPYSDFSYRTAGRQENIASIMHTQNIKPNWNFAMIYRKISSPGYYKTQRNNDDNFALSTVYKSLNKHYRFNAAMVYNKEQHDENGGIANPGDLDTPALNNRRTVATNYQSEAYSTTRSSVSNVLRDFTLRLQNSYTWGATDTLFDEDDTAAYSYSITPRFSITHSTTLSTEKHAYKDLTPDSMRYTSLFHRSFANNGNGYYAAGSDSVFTQQKWFWADNKILLNGFIGKAGRQLQFSAGAGIRYDQFISDPVAKPIADSPYYRLGYERKSRTSNYFEGQIRKEALSPGEWEYGAATHFIYTGEYAGNFSLNAMIGKDLNNNAGSFIAGAKQESGSAPYNLTDYRNAYQDTSFSFSPESITSAYATFDNQRYHFAIGARVYFIKNYIYLNEKELPAQFTNTFTMPQLWLRKVFRLGSFYLDNELVYQAETGERPVNIPEVMGRHQFSYEQALFKNAIRIATGIEARYNMTYSPAGYNAQFNRFFYQNTENISNTPELAVFLNFRIKRFRAFIMGDNLQQIFARNAILFTGTPRVSRTDGTSVTSAYAAPNTLLRFGFNWVMVN
jgi:hypothetical protein